MSIRAVVLFLLGAWLLAYGWSFAGYRLTPPDGSGFTRGINRVSLFLVWQGIAAALGLAAWMLGRKLQNGTLLRRLSRVPILVLIGFVIGLIAVIVYLIVFGRLLPDGPLMDRLAQGERLITTQAGLVTAASFRT